MKLGHFAAAAAMGLGFTQFAHATTVDFEEIVENIYDSPIQSGGLVFANDGFGFDDDFFIVGPSFPSSNGTNTLAPNYYGSTTTVSAVSGAAFTLVSFDFSDAFDFADDPIQVDFTFDTLSGIVTKTFFADFDFGMQTEQVGVSGILSFSFVTSGSFFGEDTIQTDNWVYTLDAVPEPETWAMMAAGFGLLGGAMRRQRAIKVKFAA